MDLQSCIDCLEKSLGSLKGDGVKSEKQQFKALHNQQVSLNDRMQQQLHALQTHLKQSHEDTKHFKELTQKHRDVNITNVQFEQIVSQLNTQKREAVTRIESMQAQMNEHKSGLNAIAAIKARLKEQELTNQQYVDTTLNTCQRTLNLYRHLLHVEWDSDVSKEQEHVSQGFVFANNTTKLQRVNCDTEKRPMFDICSQLWSMMV